MANRDARDQQIRIARETVRSWPSGLQRANAIPLSDQRFANGGQFEKVPDRNLTLTQRLCKRGLHKLHGGLHWKACTRPGCGYYWEYD